METLSPKIGIYMIWDVYYETQNGKSFPVAKVQFKEAHWSKFGDKDYIIRLGALYNPSSVGPKHILPRNLLFYCLKITEMVESTDAENPFKKRYKVVWDLIKPQGYDDLVQQRGEIEADFIFDIDPELHSIVCDEYLAESEAVSNGDALIEPDEMGEPDKFNPDDDAF